MHTHAYAHTELEWMLSEKGAVKTELEEDPRKKRQIRDVMSVTVRQTHHDPEDSDDDSDWASMLNISQYCIIHN